MATMSQWRQTGTTGSWDYSASSGNGSYSSLEHAGYYDASGQWVDYYAQSGYSRQDSKNIQSKSNLGFWCKYFHLYWELSVFGIFLFFYQKSDKIHPVMYAFLNFKQFQLILGVTVPPTEMLSVEIHSKPRIWKL